MMKRCALLFIISLACSNLTYAQSGLSRAIEASLRTSSRATRVSRKLHQRVKTSYTQATRTLLDFPDASSLLDTGPSKFVYPHLIGNPKDIYPDSYFLHNSKQLTDYFLARHNRYLLQAIPQLETWRREIVYNIPNFHQAKKVLHHPQEQDMAWLATQITERTNYLLIGEIHGFREIQSEIRYLLDQLLQQHPKREIFLFTEFLPGNKIWGKTVKHSPPQTISYNVLWHHATWNGITVVGLEPQFVEQNRWTSMQYQTVSDETKGTLAGPLQQSVWASLEGLRLRNAQWLVTLKDYRQRYPQALFIIYAGAGHILYSEPYSIGTVLAGPDTFTAALVPERMKEEDGKVTSLTTTFDELTRGEFLDRVLQFKDETLTKLAGFDVRIRIAPSGNSSYLQ